MLELVLQVVGAGIAVIALWLEVTEPSPKKRRVARAAMLLVLFGAGLGVKARFEEERSKREFALLYDNDAVARQQDVEDTRTQLWQLLNSNKNIPERLKPMLEVVATFIVSEGKKDLRRATETLKEHVDESGRTLTRKVDESRTAMTRTFDDKLAASEKTTDDKLAASEKTTDDKLAASEKTTDDKLAASEKTTDDKLAAAEKTFEEKLVASTKTSDEKRAASTKTTEDKLAALQKQVDAQHARIVELEQANEPKRTAAASGVASLEGVVVENSDATPAVSLQQPAMKAEETQPVE